MTRILVVDDSSTMRDVVRLTLHAAGYEVTQAQDGVEALALAQHTPFDLVLTDVNMPNMDGIELILALRENNNYKSTPVLMLTTETDLKDRQALKAAGATGWIVKPFLPSKLVEAVNRALLRT